MKNLLTTGEYSDFEIVCEGKTFKVHKAIICPRSEYFKKAVSFGKEAEENKITLQEDEVEMIEYMLQYLYEGDYTLPAPAPSASSSTTLPAQQNTGSLFGGASGAQSNAPGQQTGGTVSDVPRRWPAGAASTNNIFASGAPSAGSTRPFPFTTSFTTAAPTAPSSSPGLFNPNTSSSSGFAIHDGFPHTCLPGCNRTPCRHHKCGRDCLRQDVNYTCRKCTVPKPVYPDQRPEDLLCHVKLYALADKYMIEGLKELVAPRFKIACEVLWHHAEFLEAAELVYSTTPDNDKALRDVIVDTFDEHLELLDEAEYLMRAENGLAFALLKKLAAKRQNK
jgi:hypothetical protein